jgi:Xaa-Pro aminopeptidase
MDSDTRLLNDNWSDLSRFRPLPVIDHERLRAYRLGRLRTSLRRHGAAMVLLVNPISLRYALDYRTYLLWQAHAHTTYAFVPADGPVAAYNVYGNPPGADSVRIGRANTYFDGATELVENARLIAADVADYLREIGSSNRRIAVEYVNPSVTQALLQAGFEVIDGVNVAEEARVIKSAEEIECIKWAVAVAEHGIAQVKSALRPGATELQLWGLLNYTNLANNGDWHNGRMLASGSRINPWLQEATDKRVEDGDLVGFDTDMVGPLGYFADISRTFHCGPSRPTKRQRELYRLALEEITYNSNLVRPGRTLSEIQKLAWIPPEEFQENAYVCILHGVGMTDEFPRINPAFRGQNPYDGVLEAGMVLCIESYMGAVGERDGVKLEQQVLVTEAGIEPLSTYPLEEELLE